MAALTALLGLLTSLVAAQSPGPDYPLCATTSSQANWGYEVTALTFQPHDKRPYKAIVGLEVYNLADGSHTGAYLIRNNTKPAVDAGENVILTNADGDVGTEWVDKYDNWGVNGTAQPAAEVRFDMAKRELSISQTWACRREDGSLATYRGTAKKVFDYDCYPDREEDFTKCYVKDMYLAPEPPLFLGPGTVKPVDNVAPAPAVDCSSAKGWQVVAMAYHPPVAQRTGSPYAGASVYVELRNLAAQTRTLCSLEANDISTANTTGVVLDSRGKIITDQDATNACSTGMLDPATQAWVFQPAAARVFFNTKTHVLSIRDVWQCRGARVEGAADQKLDMVCQGTGNSMVPQSCAPRDALYSETSKPVILAPL